MGDPEPLIECYTTPEGYSDALTDAIQTWSKTVTWTSKDLRKCILTWVHIKGIHLALWEEYTGHAPKGVTARHYVPRLVAVSGGESDEIVKQMDVFRKFVVKPLETAITRIAVEKKINLFSPEALSGVERGVSKTG